MKREPEKYKLTDEELIKRFQAGDEAAFEEIVSRYANRLMNFAYRFVLDKKEAEDIVQDTFLKVYQSRQAYKEIAKFSTWIYTITGNLAKTVLRKRKHRKVFFLSKLGPEGKEIELPSPLKGPEKQVECKFSMNMIQKAIERLPEHFKTVIILRDIQELSYEEISKIINVPLGTVKSRINRARLHLQEELKQLRDR